MSRELDMVVSISWNEELKRKKKEHSLEQRIRKLEEEVAKLKAYIKFMIK